MKYIVGNTAGFCFGVKNAVESAREKLKTEKSMCCLGEIVHNKEVVKELQNSGMTFIEELNENKKKQTTIIRAHGVGKSTYEEAKDKNINIIDLTCPYVLKIHRMVEKSEKEGYFVVIIGAKKHPETIGTEGFCQKAFAVIQEKDDIPDAVKKFKESNLNKIFIVVQTTFNLEKFTDYVYEIKKYFLNTNIEIKVENTICLATKERQEETSEMSKKVDYMIIIGGKNSSNTKKLYEIAKQNCNGTICIETYKELDANALKGKNLVGIMAGASTPNSSISEVIDFIKDI